MVERAHARLAPSAAHRWRKCPGSLALIEQGKAQGIVTDERSPAARAGVVAMALVEELVRAEGSLDSALPALLEREDIEPPVDPTELGAETCKGAVAVWENWQRRIIGPANAACAPWAVEARVTIRRAGTEGTPDIRALLPDRLIVGDLKWGTGVWVSPRENAQMTLYASGVADIYELPEDFPVVLMVFQPRHHESPPEGFTMWVTTVGWCHEKAEEWSAFARDNPDHIETGDHCKFCDATTFCPARQAEVAAVLDAEIDGQTNAIREEEALARILTVAKRVEDLIKASKSRAIAILSAGKPVPGFRLGNGKSMSVWKAGAEQAARIEYGDEAFVTTLLTPAQARDNLPDGDEFFRRWSRRVPGNPVVVADEGAEAAPLDWPAPANRSK